MVSLIPACHCCLMNTRRGCSLCQCEGLKKELEELQQLHEGSQRERAALQLQLQSCKAELQELLGRKLQVRGQKVSGSWVVLL